MVFSEQRQNAVRKRVGVKNIPCRANRVRFLRWLGNFALWLSVLLFTLTCALWVRSYSAHDHYSLHDERRVAPIQCPGFPGVFISQDCPPKFAIVSEDGSLRWGRFGFDPTSGQFIVTEVFGGSFVPYCLLALLTGVLPLLHVWLKMRSDGAPPKSLDSAPPAATTSAPRQIVARSAGSCRRRRDRHDSAFPIGVQPRGGGVSWSVRVDGAGVQRKRFRRLGQLRLPLPAVRSPRRLRRGCGCFRSSPTFRCDRACERSVLYRSPLL